MKYTVLSIRYNRQIEVVLDKKKYFLTVPVRDLRVFKNNIYFRIMMGRAINSKSAIHKQGHNTITAKTHLF